MPYTDEHGNYCAGSKPESLPLFGQKECSQGMNALDASALKWMDSHPFLMSLFMRFALEKLAKRQRFGIAALTERVRWECPNEPSQDGADSTASAGFKISNNHRAYIARWLIRQVPALRELITLRPVTAE